MAWCRSGRILLVFPDSAKILVHQIDLMLLFRSSQKLGAQLAIVSGDPEVQINAKEIGIPVFSTATIAQKSPWRRTHFRKKIFDKKETGAKLSELQAMAKELGVLFQQSQKLRIAVFIVGILAVLSLAWFFVPSAKVIVPIIQKKQTINIPVWASPSLLTVNPSGGLPATISSIIVETQGQAASSGTILVADTPAAATVKFTNLTPTVVNVPQGTILLTFSSQSVRFKVLQSVAVPAGSGQTINASIQAVKAGSTGNVAAGAINAFEGSLGLRLVVTNPEAAHGGSDRTASAPTLTDYSALEEKLKQQLSQAAFQEIQAKLTTGEKIIPGTLKLTTIVQEKREPEVGLPADSLKLTMRAEFLAWHIQNKDLARVAEIALNANLEPGMAEVDELLRFCEDDDLTVPDFEENLLQGIRLARGVGEFETHLRVAEFVVHVRRHQLAVGARELAKADGLRERAPCHERPAVERSEHLLAHRLVCLPLLGLRAAGRLHLHEAGRVDLLRQLREHGLLHAPDEARVENLE